MKVWYLIYDKQLQRHVTMRKRWYHEWFIPANVEYAVTAESREQAESTFKFFDSTVKFGG